MFTTHPPLPTAEAIRDLRRDPETMRVLRKLRADVVATTGKLELESILALAHQHHPEAETHYQAAAMLGLEIMDALRALAQHGEDVRSLGRAEAARLAPVVAEAARRDLEIEHLLEGISRQLGFVEPGTNSRRNNLLKAGVAADDVERLISQGAEDRKAHHAELIARRRSLLTEQTALGRFLQTRDESHLPEGFGATAASANM